MWVVDNGYIGNDQICKAQLLVIDLEKDSVIKQIKIPFDISRNSTGMGKLNTVIVDFKEGSCLVENVNLEISDIYKFF